MKLYSLSAVCFFPVESGCPVRLNSIRQLSETWLSPGLPAGSPYSGLLAPLAILLELRKFSFYLECVVYGNPRAGTGEHWGQDADAGRFRADFAPSGTNDAGLFVKMDRCTVLVWGDSFQLQEIPVRARKSEYKLVVECNLAVVQPDYNLASIRRS